MALAVVDSRALDGLASPRVRVEVDLAGGLPAFTIVGLADTEVRESRERVRAALVNSGFEFPARRITVNLAPADLPKESARFDLPIALAILAAAGQIPSAVLQGLTFVGELSLTGALRPVKLPLRRGLLGVRLLVARPETAEALMHVETSGELIRGFRMGYDRAWLDAWTFEAMGFAIVYGNNYSGLFDMLRAGRFDYLSRGVNELPAELAEPRLAGRGLVVVPGIALYYPLDDYFWVSPRRPELHAAIERGFLRVLEDGRYAALFNRHYGRAMREARLGERSVLHLPGYPVPPGTPLEHFDVLQPEVSRARLVPPVAP